MDSMIAWVQPRRKDSKIPMRQILVADADGPLRAAIGHAVDEAGYAWTGVSDAIECWQQLRSNPPDLLIVDLFLPGTNGYALTEALRAEPRTSELPIIMISGRTEQVYQRISVDLGIAWYCQKPIDRHRLMARVTEIFAAPSRITDRVTTSQV